MIGFDTDTRLGSIDDLRRLLTEQPRLQDSAAIAESVETVRRNGVFDPFGGYVRPAELDIRGTNFRESIVGLRTNSRGRGFLLALADLVVERGPDVDVYAAESITPMADRLRDVFGEHFTGSEYLPSAAQRKMFPNIRHEDVQALSFPDASLDVYLSCEVLEHVPDLDQALHEARRVLRPDGCFLGTVPFAYGSERSTVRARLRDGEVEHLLPPEYHGNPTSPSEGSLVYEIPGWDLLGRLRGAGFRTAGIRFIASTRYGVTGAEIAGVFLFEAWA